MPSNAEGQGNDPRDGWKDILKTGEELREEGEV